MKCGQGKDGCLCETCEHRFECFTQERIFSDNDIQSLYEAFRASMSKEEALEKIAKMLEDKINQPISVPHVGSPVPDANDNGSWKMWWDDSSGNISDGYFYGKAESCIST